MAPGRQETRACTVLPISPYAEHFTLAGCDLSSWVNLKTLVMVESHSLRQGELATAKRFFLSSLAGSARHALAKVRQPWGIENQQHYPLEVTFHEDAARSRKGFAALNLAALRRLALNLLNLDDTPKLSRRRKGAWSK